MALLECGLKKNECRIETTDCHWYRFCVALFRPSSTHSRIVASSVPKIDCHHCVEENLTSQSRDCLYGRMLNPSSRSSSFLFLNLLFSVKPEDKTVPFPNLLSSLGSYFKDNIGYVHQSLLSNFCEKWMC